MTEAAFLAQYLCYEDGQVYNTRSYRYRMNPPGGVPSVPGDNYLAAPSLCRPFLLKKKKKKRKEEKIIKLS